MQVENEYGIIEAAYKDAGAEYVQWAGAMAVDLNTSVPWIMCNQKNAPGSIVSLIDVLRVICNAGSFPQRSRSNEFFWGIITIRPLLSLLTASHFKFMSSTY